MRQADEVEIGVALPEAAQYSLAAACGERVGGEGLPRPVWPVRLIRAQQGGFIVKFPNLPNGWEP